MTPRTALWLCLLAGTFSLLSRLLPSATPSDSGGAAAPTLLTADPNDLNSPTNLLCYTAIAPNQQPALLSLPLPPNAQRPTPNALLTSSPFRQDDYRGALNGQFAGRDRLYYIGRGWDGQSRVCLARYREEEWAPEGRSVMAGGTAGAWDVDGITWISILPPDKETPRWRMWYIGRQRGVGRIGRAESSDGVKWQKEAAPILSPPAGMSFETVSVQPYAGTLRAWIVQQPVAAKAGRELITVSLPTSGESPELPEPVAWQAPEIHFGNLPRNAIPLQDARAVVGEKGPRHIRLYLTYLGKDGKPQITTAENFPVAGDREPTIFRREVKPLVEPAPSGKGSGGEGLRTGAEFVQGALFALAAASLMVLCYPLISRIWYVAIGGCAALLFVLSLSNMQQIGAPFTVAVLAGSSVVRVITFGVLVGGLAVWMRNRLRLGAGGADQVQME